MADDIRRKVAVHEAHSGMLQRMATAILGLGALQAAIIILGIGAACWAQWHLKQTSRFKLGISNRTTILGQFTALTSPIVCIVGWLVAWGLLG